MLKELAYAQGVQDGMAKFAISKYRQYARDISQQAWNSQQPADIAKARAAVQGAYKPRVLGTGAEGTATLRMIPQAAEGGALTPTVRKEFDPKATMASPELFNRRVALGPELNATGNFAKYYGHGQTAAGRKYIDSEFVPGKIAPGTDVTKAQAAIDRSLRSTGMRTGMGHLAAKDIRAENLGVDPKTKQVKALDAIPVKRQEAYDPRYARMALGPGGDPTALFPTHEGSKLFTGQARARFADPQGTQQAKARGQMQQVMATAPQTVIPPVGGAASLPAPASPAAPAPVPASNVSAPWTEAPTGIHSVQPPPQQGLPSRVAGPSVFGSL